MTKIIMLYFFPTNQTRRPKKLDPSLVRLLDERHAYGNLILILTFVP